MEHSWGDLSWLTVHVWLIEFEWAPLLQCGQWKMNDWNTNWKTKYTFRHLENPTTTNKREKEQNEFSFSFLFFKKWNKIRDGKNCVRSKSNVSFRLFVLYQPKWDTVAPFFVFSFLYLNMNTALVDSVANSFSHE